MNMDRENKKNKKEYEAKIKLKNRTAQNATRKSGIEDYYPVVAYNIMT